MIVSILSLFILFSTVFGKLRKVKLYADSNYKQIDNMGLYPWKETSSSYYLFLKPQSYQLTYDDVKKNIYYQDPSKKKYYFKVSNNILQLSAGNPSNVAIGPNNRLGFNGASGLYAVKNINDPVGYSKNNYAIKYYSNPPKGSYKIKYIYARYV